MPARESSDRAATPCSTCALRKAPYFCGSLFEGDDAGPAGRLPCAPVGRSHQIASRRRNIYRNNDSSSSVAVICEGWACSYISLSNGKRQILSFLLPGDLTSAAAVFRDQSGCSIEAVTDIHYCMLDKAELRSALAANPEILNDFSRRWAEHEEEIGKLATDLGHKTAEQRIARLILGLMERQSARNQVHDGRFDFPLRQQHIADATGLTVVHVNRVLGSLRRHGILDIKGRVLSVLDLLQLQHIGH